MKILEQSDNFYEYSRLYKEVFYDDIDREKFDSIEDKNKFLIVDGYNSIGFVILDNKAATHKHIWLMGMRSDYQNNGYGKLIMEELFINLRSEGYKKLTLSTYNHRRKMLALAIKKGFIIEEFKKGNYGDNRKVILSKNLTPKKEIRISLCNYCNFKCIFCHNEGLEPAESNRCNNTSSDNNGITLSKDNLKKILNQAVENGYTDITFTGGEPLLNKETLIFGIQYSNKFEEKPDLTIVTNGSKIDNRLIEEIKGYRGKIKVNLSMHTGSDKDFNTIMLPNNKEVTKNTILESLKLLKNNNITTKLNHVFLKGFNNSDDDIRKFIEVAMSLEVDTVKFLELLVAEFNEQHYGMYYGYNGIKEKIAKVCSEMKGHLNILDENKRLIRYQFVKDSKKVKLEVVKLTCKVGCKNCHEIRDRTIGADGQYYPCFVNSNEPVGDALENMREAFEQGDKIIEEYAKKYGDQSPILEKQANYVKKRESVFFQIDSPLDKVKKELRDLGFRIDREDIFEEEYLLMPAAANLDHWDNHEKVFRIGRKAKNDLRYEIYLSKYSYRREGEYLINSQEFMNSFDKPIYFDSFNKVREFSGMLDYKIVSSYTNTPILFYKGNEISFSILSVDEGRKVSLMTDIDNAHKIEGKLEEINTKNIEIPFIRWRRNYSNNITTE